MEVVCYQMKYSTSHDFSALNLSCEMKPRFSTKKGNGTFFIYLNLKTGQFGPKYNIRVKSDQILIHTEICSFHEKVNLTYGSFSN